MASQPLANSVGASLRARITCRIAKLRLRLHDRDRNRKVSVTGASDNRGWCGFVIGFSRFQSRDPLRVLRSPKREHYEPFAKDLRVLGAVGAKR